MATIERQVQGSLPMSGWEGGDGAASVSSEQTELEIAASLGGRQRVVSSFLALFDFFSLLGQCPVTQPQAKLRLTQIFFHYKSFPSSICSLAAHAHTALPVTCPILLPEQLMYPQPWSQESPPLAEARCSFPHGLSYSHVALQPGVLDPKTASVMSQEACRA